ncbi:MAG: hypothetical protein KAU31_15225 [Spirochaetaceae bacterium]|nr:hypothetical protein [Spirochaetaceae bacterium]
MKRIITVAIFVALATGAVAADEPNPIADAMAHARIDSAGYEAIGWGALAFGGSALIGPLLGGGAVIIAANVIEPDVSIPAARIAEAQDSYETSSEVLLYQAQYQESMAKPIQKARSRRAWIGTGIGFGVNLLLISAILGS